MGLEVGIELVKNIIGNTSIFGSFWIYQLTILMASLLIITRNYKDWGDLALPLVVGWKLIGIDYNWAFFAISGMVFVINSLSLKAIEGGLTSLVGGISSIGDKFSSQKRMERKYEKALRASGIRRIGNKQIDIQKEMEKLGKIRLNKQLKGEIPFERGLTPSDVMEIRDRIKGERLVEKEKTRSFELK